MAARFSDTEIASLVQERKPLPQDYQTQIQLRPKRGHKERQLDVLGANGNLFRIILRQSNLNILDFSIILAICPQESNQLFRLRRYNGRSHEHTNTIERETFYSFHIHIATERYQQLGVKEDWFAEETDRFGDFFTALNCMLGDCEFVVPEHGQGRLFGEL